MLSRKIVRVTKTEFETADGIVRPMLFEPDEVPTVEEFQEIYDDWFNVFLEKPVDLCEYLIKTYTDEGDLVLDNCAGSGSTGVACINTKRKFVGIELDQDFCLLANKRMEEACCK